MTQAEKKALAYYAQIDAACPTLATYSRNLNLAQLRGQLDACYHRDGYIQRIQQILLRKNKANVLLTGISGCGKTAIAEGTAACITQRKLNYEQACIRVRHKNRGDGAFEDSDINDTLPPKPPLCDCVLYELSLTALLGGTRYRGDFEERLQRIIDECKETPNAILFIDEAHRLTCAGIAAEGENSAQMLKPALARNDIRVIAATTNDERAMIVKDKALWRRFCEITVAPLTGEAAKDTAVKILQDYCRHHGIVTDVSGDDLWEQVQRPGAVFPDAFIDVIDEALAQAVFEDRYAVSTVHFQRVLHTQNEANLLG